jgi:hypothetical protein
VHQVVAGAPVAGIGLALEMPRVGNRNDEILARVGIREAGIVSAMIAVTAEGAEVLWAPP